MAYSPSPNESEDIPTSGQDDDIFEALQATTSIPTHSPLRSLGKKLSAVFDSALGQTSRIVSSNAPAMEPVNVFLRLRPLPAGEESCIDVQSNGRTVRATAPEPLNQRKEYREPRDYSFTRVLDETTTQEAMFSAAAEDIVNKFRTEGKSGLVFTYGVTNAGKSHTVLGSKEDPGLLPRAMELICRGLDFSKQVSQCRFK